MLKSVFIFLWIIIQCTHLSAQNPKFQVEGYIGTQRIHHHQCNLEDKTFHRGYTMSTGFRFHFNLNRRFGIVAGYTLNNMVGDNFKFPLERLLRFDLRYNFGFSSRFPRMSYNAEAGGEYAYYDKKLKFPLYLGGQYNINPYMDFFARLRLPNLIEVDELSLYQFVEMSVELGVALNPKWCNRTKYDSSTGNPFILQ